MLKIFPDTESLNNFAAEKFIEIANRAIEEKDRFAVALSGGSTPKLLYRLLAAEFKTAIDWSRAFFFFGDERNVPLDDAESNYRMASETLLVPQQISPENIFRWKTELENAEEVAEDYEKNIEDFFDLKKNPPATAGGTDKNSPVADDALPRFDLILLGLGADGHTASLFPFTKAVSTACGSGRVIAFANKIEKLNETRLTLTFSAINSAANIIFLVTGAEKAGALREVLQGEYEPEKFPAQNVKPVNGNLLWLVDAKAARLLN